MLDTFHEDTTLFGKTTRTDNDGISYMYGPDEVVSMLKYAMVDVFRCAEQIISNYGRSTLDYAIYHRERTQALDTYQSYIHLVACHCFVLSNFLGPAAEFPLVEFAKVEPPYRGDTVVAAIVHDTK